jgi:hypothetical protein
MLARQANRSAPAWGKFNVGTGFMPDQPSVAHRALKPGAVFVGASLAANLAGE